jgi:DNA-binding MarR family transcriptional regulator
MSRPDPGLAQGWCALSALHSRLEARIERALQNHHGLSAREFSVLVVLSQSATTRLVTRLEERGLLTRYLCPDDRRGIYTDVTESGHALLEAARPTNDTALREALDAAEERPELAPLVKAVRALEPSA